MNSNPNPIGSMGGRIEADDDVEGHSIKGHVDGPDTEDVEGHKRVGGLVADEATEDVEGHGIKVHGLTTEDDTEGHVIRGKG